MQASTTTVKKVNMIEMLKKEATTNKCLNAILHIFAIRERARQQVTFGALKQKMSEEGFQFTDNEYDKALKFLASAGVGRLETNGKGKAKALKDIKVTLQSLGLATVAQGEIKKFSPRNKYTNLPVVPPKTPPAGAVRHDEPQLTNFQRQVPEDAIKVNPGHSVQNVALTASINGMPVVFVIADSLETHQLGKLLVKLSDKNLLLDMN